MGIENLKIKRKIGDELKKDLKKLGMKNKTTKGEIGMNDEIQDKKGMKAKTKDPEKMRTWIQHVRPSSPPLAQPPLPSPFVAQRVANVEDLDKRHSLARFACMVFDISATNFIIVVLHVHEICVLVMCQETFQVHLPFTTLHNLEPISTCLVFLL
jgi:hypothetical protein